MRTKCRRENGFSVIRSLLIAHSIALLVTPARSAAQEPTILEQNRFFYMGYAAGEKHLTVPCVDAAGVTYHAPSGHLFIVDSEIEEIPAVWNDIQANVFEVSRNGQMLYARFDLQNDEPTGITYNAFDDHFYVTNDDTARIYRYAFDGSGFTEVDSASTLPDSPDPEGVASDPATGTIYVLEGSLRRIVVFAYQGGFVQTSTIALATCPNGSAGDVEGIVFDPQSGHLFVVSQDDLAIHEYDLGGSCVSEHDLSALSPRPIAPQGLALGPPTAGDAPQAFYVADGGVDNGQNPNEHDASIYEASIVPAPAGEAFHFNGIGDYLQVPRAPELYPPTLTVAAWIRPNRLGPEEYVLSTKDSGGYSLGIDIQNGATNPGVLSSRCRVGSVYYNVYGTTPLAYEEWVHVALTYDGAVFRLYVNGAEDGSLAVAGTLKASSGDLFIGAESDGTVPKPGDRFAGRIDEVALWNVALTPGEIGRSCTPFGDALPAPANLVALWRFEDLAGGVTPDSVGSNDALVFGAGHVAPGPGGASVLFRNSAPNPASYTASAPALGGTWVARVDLTTTGHAFARVLGYTSPAQWELAGGQMLLVGGAKLFTLHAKAGPVATWNVPIPGDCALLGLEACTQAIHLHGAGAFALSNAQDVVIGY